MPGRSYRKARSMDKSKDDNVRDGRPVGHSKEASVSIPEGLVMLRGFNESGVAENNNFARFWELFENYTQKTYPKLVRMISDPFGPEVKVKIPDILKKKKKIATVKNKNESVDPIENSDDDKSTIKEGSDNDIDYDGDAGKLLQQQIVRKYASAVDELIEAKCKLAATLWQVLGRFLQERIRLKGEKELSDYSRKMADLGEEFDADEFAEKHSKFTLAWLVPTVVQIMSLGETASQDPSLLRTNAKKAIEKMSQLKTESIVDYKQRFIQAYERYEALVARHGDGYYEAGECVGFKYESERDRATRFLESLDKARYIEFIVQYRNNVKIRGVYENVDEVVEDAQDFQVVRRVGKADSNGHIPEVAVMVSQVARQPNQPKKNKGSTSENGGGGGGGGSGGGGRNKKKDKKKSDESKQEQKAAAEEVAEKANPNGRKPPACWKCGSKSHLEPDCNRHDLPASDKYKAWAAEHDINFIGAEEDDIPGFVGMTRVGSGATVDAPDDKRDEVVVTLRTDLRRARLHDRDMLYDTGSEAPSIFRSADLLTNVREVERGIRILGVDTSEGGFHSNLVGDHPHFGLGYICPLARSNILSGAMLEDMHDVALVKGEGYVVTCSDGTVYRFRRRGRLYVCSSDRDVERTGELAFSVSLSTVRDRERMFSRRELLGARRAREIKLNSGLLSNRDIARIPWRGMGIVPADVSRAEFIYGKDFESAAGKTTQRDYGVKTEYVPLPEAPLAVQKGYADLFAIGPLWFLLVVLKPLDYVHVQPLDSQQADHIALALLAIVYDAQSRGFTIPTMAVDPQSSILKCRIALATVGCVMEPVAAGEHVAVAERVIKTIEERVRGGLSGDDLFPYRLDKVMMVHVVLWFVQCRNSVPSTASPNVSPREAYLGRVIDYSVEMRTRCGAYCQVTETVGADYNSSFVPRVVDAIALMSTGSLTGSWKFLSLRTGKIIVRTKFTVQPTTDRVIAEMNARADAGKMKFDRVPRFLMRRRLSEPVVVPAERGRGRRVVQHGQDMRSVIPDARAAMDGDPFIRVSAEERAAARAEKTLVRADDAIVVSPPGDDAAAERTDEIDVVPAERTEAATGVASNDEVKENAATIEDDVARAKAAQDVKSDLPPPEPPPEPENVFKRMTRSSTRASFYGLAAVCLNLSLQQARKRRGAEADAAGEAEIRQIVDRGTVRGRLYSSLSDDELQKVLPLHMFYKEKFEAGQYLKMKGRSVVLGNFQDRTQYSRDETSAPTVSLLALMIVVVIALKFCMCSMSFDVTGAYLYAKMRKPVVVYFPPHLARMLVKVAPEFAQYLCPKGGVYCDLIGALYGTIEAARLWYDHVSATLKRLGFKANQLEPCVFERGSGEEWVIVTLYVDDGKAFCRRQELLVQLGRDISAAYTATFNFDLKSQYLGMLFDYTEPGVCLISMPKLIDDVLTDMDVKGGSKYPHDSNLYSIDENSPALDAKRVKVFYSVVYKLYYCALRVEVRIQVAVHFLTTRVTKPTEEDWSKLMKVLRFLNCTARGVIRLAPNGGPLCVEWWIDVGHAIHFDMRSQTGSVGRLNDATIYVRTSKQKRPSKSATESEFVGVSDEASAALWCNEFMFSLGLLPECAIIREDNTACIMLHQNGRSNSARTRHIKIREWWLKYHIDAKEIEFVWVEGKQQLADALSKPVVGRLFVDHFDNIHGVVLVYRKVYPR